jgi:hypothetical protein
LLILKLVIFTLCFFSVVIRAVYNKIVKRKAVNVNHSVVKHEVNVTLK